MSSGSSSKWATSWPSWNLLTRKMHHLQRPQGINGLELLYPGSHFWMRFSSDKCLNFQPSGSFSLGCTFLIFLIAFSPRSLRQSTHTSARFSSCVLGLGNCKLSPILCSIANLMCILWVLRAVWAGQVTGQCQPPQKYKQQIIFQILRQDWACKLLWKWAKQLSAVRPSENANYYFAEHKTCCIEKYIKARIISTLPR